MRRCSERSLTSRCSLAARRSRPPGRYRRRARTVEALIGKSLINRRRQPDGTTRLLMLETIRQYALGRLAADPERHAVHRRHCDHYLQLVEQAVPRLSTRDEQRALAELDAEIDNLRSALRWALRPHRRPACVSPASSAGTGSCALISRDCEWLDAALLAAGERAPLTDRARARLHHANQLSSSQPRRSSDRRAPGGACALSPSERPRGNQRDAIYTRRRCGSLR